MQLAVAGTTGSPLSADVHYLVVESGVYDAATYGVQLEAVKYNSTVADENNSWVGETRTYGQSYVTPVVVGQVMSANDPEESVFWARGSSRTNPPNASNLVTGKTVNEDPNTTRANETIGYVVLEAGNGSVAGLNYQALLGADSVRGVGNAPPYDYVLSGLSAASVAVTSLAGMDGNNGGWALLYGPLDPSGASIYPAVWSLMLSARSFGVGTTLTTILGLFKHEEVAELLGRNGKVRIRRNGRRKEVSVYDLGDPIGGKRRAEPAEHVVAGQGPNAYVVVHR